VTADDDGKLGWAARIAVAAAVFSLGLLVGAAVAAWGCHPSEIAACLISCTRPGRGGGFAGSGCRPDKAIGADAAGREGEQCGLGSIQYSPIPDRPACAWSSSRSCIATFRELGGLLHPYGPRRAIAAHSRRGPQPVRCGTGRPQTLRRRYEHAVAATGTVKVPFNFRVGVASARQHQL
jgi:hypothetical protein